MIKMGVSPIGWSNDDMPELGGDISLGQCLEDTKNIGFTGVELGNKFSRDPETLKTQLAPCGLNLISGWYSLRLFEMNARQQFKAFVEHFRLMQTLKCDLMVVAETTHSIQTKKQIPVRDRHEMSKDEWKYLTRELDELSRIMTGEGMPMSYHHHMGTVIQYESEIDRLMEETKNVNLLIDSGHLSYCGGSATRVYENYSECVNHIHLKDIRQKVVEDTIKSGKSFLDGVFNGTFTVPGDGDYDFSSFLKIIQEKKYSGWLVIEAEQNPAIAPPFEYGKKGFNYIQSLITT